ncbi:MAG: hypothetical protein M9920_06835 [Verrucomicrobiae bacterium]|nr:hypothetical protein [Verrucomicrobiae bacterium]
MRLISLKTVSVGFLGWLVAYCGTSTLSAAETNEVLQVRAKTLSTTQAAPKSAAADEDKAPAPTTSTFVIPKQPSEGRDPFFPNSTRVYTVNVIQAPEAPKVEADLTLKGISGTPEQPLAIINTTTFTTGEVNEVITKTGRPKITCVEINMSAGTVLIQIGAERRELRLAPQK